MRPLQRKACHRMLEVGIFPERLFVAASAVGQPALVDVILAVAGHAGLAQPLELLSAHVATSLQAAERCTPVSVKFL